MAEIDPYASCPCGSGKKFKWCCQSIESYADRAWSLFQNGQLEASLEAIDEGLAKSPLNPWLSFRKSLILASQERDAEAQGVLRDLIASQPQHITAHMLLLRMLLESGDASAAIDVLQESLRVITPDKVMLLASVTPTLAQECAESGLVPSAQALLEWVGSVDPRFKEDGSLESTLYSLRSNPKYSAWLRNPYRLRARSALAEVAHCERFELGLTRAASARWGEAAILFDELARAGDEAALLNAGLCRVWLADYPAAAANLRQWIATQDGSAESVDGESLCQLIDPGVDENPVDRLHLIWSLRNRDGLRASLDGSDRVSPVGPGTLDLDGNDAFEVDSFQVLDRSRKNLAEPYQLSSLPRVIGYVHVGQEIVILDGNDDGKLDALTAWFTDLAATAIPPAQPRTKRVGRIPRYDAAVSSTMWVPEETPPADRVRLEREELTRILIEVWPTTPHQFLKDRTPLEAARDGGLSVAVRAALCRLELSDATREIDLNVLRSKLNLPPEPAVPVEGLDIPTLHIARLHRVPADQLGDEELIALYRRAAEFNMVRALDRILPVIVERPALLDRPDISRVEIFGNLANLAAARGQREVAFEWLNKGRQSDPAARTTHAVHWDMIDIRLRSRFDDLKDWVPSLVLVMERYREPPEVVSILFSNLLDMGLVQLVPHPDEPGQVMMDARLLHTLIAQYGPRITTAAGGLGAAAAAGQIWTPDTPGGSTTAGGIWTPGESASAGKDKPKLFIPGR